MGRTFSLNWLRSDLFGTLPQSLAGRKSIESALELSYRYHSGQFREQKASGKPKIPYITHPVGVAKICAELFPFAELDDKIDDILAVALTHDLLEDTTVELSELENATSHRAVELVQTLTKPNAAEFSSRAERNRVFLDAISDAGATAKFVKICDALHNLSRPEGMPPSLLSKTVRKAKRDYLPLVLDKRFLPDIGNRLRAAIAEAEQSLVREIPKETHYSSIEEFLRYCIERASGKILEAHDIWDILLELPGVQKIHEGSIDGFVNIFLSDVLTKDVRRNSEIVVSRLLDRCEFDLAGKPFERSRVKALTFNKVVAIPLEATTGGRRGVHLAFLGIQSSKAPSWASVSSLRAIVSVLSERQRERNARELSDYAEWVASNNLSVDPRLALELRLSRHEIVKLANVIDAASIEIGAILAVVRLIGRENNSPLLVEGRIKNASSAASKFVGRAKRNWSKLDDIVGIRVVLTNVQAVKRFVATFLQQVMEPDSVWRLDIGLDPNSIVTKEVDTVGGYKAVHIYFAAHTALSDIEWVPCEIQVRTAFQDAWARVAHSTSYKKEGSGQKRRILLLKELAELCSHADELSDNIDDP